MIERRRTITVAKDMDAEHALDYNEATSDQLIELNLTENEFLEFYKKGVFDAINEIAESLIDDFEYDGITDIQKLKQVLESDVFDIPVETDKLQAIKILFEEAYSRGTGVHFFF